MKWFKHYSDALDDPFIQELLDEFSHLGYVVWFGLIEIIAKENGTNVTGKLDISPAYLRRKLRTSPTSLRQVLEFCRSNGRLFVTFSEKKWFIEFPKILEIKDNYMKDLQGACKKPSHHKEVEEEVEEEVYKKEEEEKANKNKDKKFIIPFSEILTDLKEKTGKNYRLTKTTKELIKARWVEGFSLEDFLKVHTNMSAKWQHDPKMNQYLRPTTLYCASKFEGYLNAQVSLSDQGKISPLLDKSQKVFQDFIKEGEENVKQDQI